MLDRLLWWLGRLIDIVITILLALVIAGVITREFSQNEPRNEIQRLFQQNKPRKEIPFPWVPGPQQPHPGARTA